MTQMSKINLIITEISFNLRSAIRAYIDLHPAKDGLSANTGFNEKKGKKGAQAQKISSNVIRSGFNNINTDIRAKGNVASRKKANTITFESTGLCPVACTLPMDIFGMDFRHRAITLSNLKSFIITVNN